MIHSRWMFVLGLWACAEHPSAGPERSSEGDTGSLDGALPIDEVASAVPLSDGAGRLLSGGQDVDGDGLEDAVIGGQSQIWILTGAGRALAATPLDLDLGDEAVGATLALSGRAAIGVPGLDAGELRFSDGARLTGDTDSGHLGASLAGWTFGLVTTVYTGAGWDLYMIGGTLPGAGEEASLGSLTSFYRVPDLAGSEAAPPVLTTSSQSGGQVAVGLPEAGAAGISAAVYNLSGSINLAFSIEDPEASALGASVAFWDVQDQNISDLAVGDPGRGVVLLYLGGSDRTPLGEEDLRFTGPPGAGTSLAMADDLDGDGVEDLIIGGADRVWLVPGWTEEQTPAEIEAAAVWKGATGAELGQALCSADLDGDGLSDLVLGAPGASEVYVVWGAPAAEPL